MSWLSLCTLWNEPWFTGALPVHHGATPKYLVDRRHKVRLAHLLWRVDAAGELRRSIHFLLRHVDSKRVAGRGPEDLRHHRDLAAAGITDHDIQDVLGLEVNHQVVHFAELLIV